MKNGIFAVSDKNTKKYKAKEPVQKYWTGPTLPCTLDI